VQDPRIAYCSSLLRQSEAEALETIGITRKKDSSGSACTVGWPSARVTAFGSARISRP
jgi:hypothetical protein